MVKIGRVVIFSAMTCLQPFLSELILSEQTIVEANTK
jgi:hypothetical protein